MNKFLRAATIFLDKIIEALDREQKHIEKMKKKRFKEELLEKKRRKRN